MREDDARPCAVVGLARLPEDVRRRDPAVVLAHVGERPDRGDVPDRPHAVAGAHARINLNAAAVDFDPELLEPDVAHPRPAIGGDEQALAPDAGELAQPRDRRDHRF
jgi:hypothetical protein